MVYSDYYGESLLKKTIKWIDCEEAIDRARWNYYKSLLGDRYEHDSQMFRLSQTDSQGNQKEGGTQANTSKEHDSGTASG